MHVQCFANCKKLLFVTVSPYRVLNPLFSVRTYTVCTRICPCLVPCHLVVTQNTASRLSDHHVNFCFTKHSSIYHEKCWHFICLLATAARNAALTHPHRVNKKRGKYKFPAFFLRREGGGWVRRLRGAVENYWGGGESVCLLLVYPAASSGKDNSLSTPPPPTPKKREKPPRNF